MRVPFLTWTCSTPSDGRFATSGSRSPTAATSAASTACRRRSTAATTGSSTAGASDLRGDRTRRAGLRRGGVRKIRITGGEPLVRRDVERLIEQLAEIGVDLTLTTNGSLLPQKAQALAAAGLTRVTVSLDSLDDATFRALNDVDFPVDRVLEGIEAAADAGLPVKVNAVVKRGVERRPDRHRWPRSSADAATRCASSSTWTSATRTAGASTTSSRRPRSSPRSTPRSALEPVDAAYRGEVAQRCRYRDGAGEIGVIASVTQPFCGDCTRARLSAEGKLYTCLFAVRGPRPARADPRRAPPTTSSQRRSRDLARAHRPLLRAPHRSDRRACRRSRCPTSAVRRQSGPVGENRST